MIFKSPSESASLLANQINAEKVSEYLLCFIDLDAKIFVDQVAQKLNTIASYLPDSLHHLPNIKNLLIVDDGETRASEYVGFTDMIHRDFPNTKILIATPVVPQSEEAIFKANCDSLITLHVEPLFFSMNQFYQVNQP